MSYDADLRRSSADRPLRLRARGDLQTVEMPLVGESNYVVKDPVTGEAFHLSAAEQALLASLRRPISLRDMQRLLESRFAPRRVSLAQLQHFVNRLYEQGLILSDAPGQGAELLERGRRRRRGERRSRWLQVLSVRVGSFDAGPLVERLHRTFGWLGSRPALVAAAALMLYAVFLAIRNAPELAGRLPATSELAQPRYLPVWLAAIVGVKVLHELGHAMTCRRLGARPQEAGVLLLAGMPSLYCDVSDAWRLPSKWQRMAVSSGGMFVELVIAAAAVVVWRYATPGLLSTVALSLVVVCSVGTLLINANPLLRYDGYYLLSDWLEVPNLAERGRGLWSGAWRSWLLGEPPEIDPLLNPRKRRAVWAYAVLSKVYLALVLAGLLVLALRLARPHQLENVVYTLAAIIAAGMLAAPLAAAVRLVRNPTVRSRFRWLRLGGAVLLLAALGAAAWHAPVTRRIRAPMMAAHAAAHPVYAVAAGELRMAAPVGAEVAQGEVIARLHNPDLQLALVVQEGAVRQKRTQLAQLRTLQLTMPAAERMIPTAAAELADAEAQLAEHQAMVDALVLRSPASGRLLAPPDHARPQPSADALRKWTGSPLDRRNLGAWIEPGTPLGVVASGNRQIAWAGVEQADVPEVAAGQSVRILADEQPTTVLTGRVRSIARRARKSDDDQRRSPHAAALSDASYHAVEIELDKDAAPLLPGARGVAKISAYESTLGAIVLDELRRTFQRVF